MRNGMIMAVALTALSAFGETVKTATQPWVRNYVATNGTSLTPATNYTNRALADFAATGTVWRSAQITDGTNTIDAARNVYRVYDDCWTRSDGYVLVRVSENGWKSINQSPWGYIELSDFGNVWYEHETAIPSEYYRDGSKLTNEVGMLSYTYGPQAILIGRVALTNDVGEAVRVAKEYTDGLETQFRLGNIKVKSAEFADSAYDARRLYDADAFITYNATDLMRAATNAAEAVVRTKSLGGIWDRQLEVWWTPIMENGALRYCATTNINMEANQ